MILSAPGEFKEVESTGIDLTKAIVPLPYKEPSGTLLQMLQFVVAGRAEVCRLHRAGDN